MPITDGIALGVCCEETGQCGTEQGFAACAAVGAATSLFTGDPVEITVTEE